MNSFGNKTATKEERGLDCYETPEIAIHALWLREPLPFIVWEPFCGPGSIVKYLRRQNIEVIASDIKDYDCPDSTVADFMSFTKAPCDNMVTNPPFRDADEHIRHAFEIGCNKLFIFQRLLFLEGKKRADIFDNYLTRIRVFRYRLPMMHRYGYDGKKSTSQVPYAWYVFEKNKKKEKPVELSWIRK